jgi:hypothetical protein
MNSFEHLAPVGGWFISCGDETGRSSAYEVRIGERPAVHPAAVSFGLGWPRDGVRWGGVSLVVKTASSRGRTGRTLFGYGDGCSPRARLRGGLRKGVIRRFDFTLRFATPDIVLASADAFAVVGGGCTGRAHGCKAKQSRRGKDGADV